MSFDLAEIRSRTVSVKEYIDGLEQPFRDKFLERGKGYRLQPEAVEQLRKSASRHAIVAFSAVWCKDCAANIPVLALIAEATGLEVRVFGGLKKDPLSHVRKWRIPPSPKEVEAFKVSRLPLMVVLDSRGKEIGRITENPCRCPTLEQELSEIIKSFS